MQLMIQNDDGDGGEDGDRCRIGWSYAVRVCLAVASVTAAYLLMSGAWPAEFASDALASMEAGSMPPAIGPALDVALSLR